MKKRLLVCVFSITFGISLVFIIFSLKPAQPVHAAPNCNTCYVSYLSGSDVDYCCGSINPCRTIQYAINKSSFCDSIQVDTGTYDEHITMKDGVSVYGRGWDYTIIDGGFMGPTSTVYIPSSVSASTYLSGFKVTRGGWGYHSIGSKGGGLQVYGSANIVNTMVYSNSVSLGGGVYVNGGSPTFNNVPVWNNYADSGGGFYIENNAVVNIIGNPFESLYNGTVVWNRTDGSGAGFFLGRATVTLIGLRIYWNSAEEEGGGLYIGENTNKIALYLNDISGNTAGMQGGGMKVWKASNLDLFGNFIGEALIGGNHAVSDGGGAIFFQSAGNVHNNWFIGNEGADGGGVAVSWTAPNFYLSYNWFEKNKADYYGGAISLFDDADPKIDGNTIVSNTANVGGGIDISEAGWLELTNNLIARNVSIVAAPITPTSGFVGVIHVYKSPAYIVNNTIASNTGGGITFDDSDNIAIVNNIIYGNNGYSIDGDVNYGTNVFTVDYNDMYANLFNTYRYVPAGAHDMNTNPLFKASGDVFNYYHLLPGSPVNTTGSPTWAPTHDIDNQVRPCAGAISMGADQLCFSFYLPLLNR